MHAKERGGILDDDINVLMDSAADDHASSSCVSVCWGPAKSFVFGMFCGLTLSMFVGLMSLVVQLDTMKFELDEAKLRINELQATVRLDRGPSVHTVDPPVNTVLQQERGYAKKYVDYNKNTSAHIIGKRSASGDRETRNRHIRQHNRHVPSVSREEVKRLLEEYTQPLLHPSAHMSLLSQNGLTVAEDGSLRWTTHLSNMSHNSVFEYDGDYSRLVVQSSGTYFIYAQIMYNGRTQRNQASACSHVLKLLPVGSDSTAFIDLLYASTTQVLFGGVINIDASGRHDSAFDHSFVAGVFHLEEGDRLYVELDAYSRTSCRVISHPESSYLGAFRIQSAWHT
jgi:hypothetical protein